MKLLYWCTFVASISFSSSNVQQSDVVPETDMVLGLRHGHITFLVYKYSLHHPFASVKAQMTSRSKRASAEFVGQNSPLFSFDQAGLLVQPKESRSLLKQKLLLKLVSELWHVWEISLNGSVTWCALRSNFQQKINNSLCLHGLISMNLPPVLCAAPNTTHTGKVQTLFATKIGPFVYC